MRDQGRSVRILFPQFVDSHNLNAQSLNVREIALRLDPERFQSTFFHTGDPDSRLRKLRHVDLRRISPRGGTLAMLAESLHGHDVLFSPALGLRFTDLYFRVPPFFRRHCLSVWWIEGLLKGNLEALDERSLRKFIRLTDQIDVHVAITEHVAQTSLRDFGLHSQAVIPIGVDTELFSPARRDCPRPPTVLFVGHLVDRKGPDLVIEAARQMPDVRFRLVGRSRDQYGEAFKTDLLQNGPKNAELLDPMPQTALSELMGRCDVLMLPSRVEGMPKVVLEAAATGLPAVIFDDYQAPVVVDGVTGYQVGTFAEMLVCLQELLRQTDTRLAMGRSAVRHARGFAWERVARQWQELLLRQIGLD